MNAALEVGVCNLGANHLEPKPLMLVSSVDCVWLNRVQCCCVALVRQHENVV